MPSPSNSSSSSPPDRRRSALIIAGAAAKGPYAAGALSVLARDERFDVRCLFGASSGALNAAVYAAGLCRGQPQEAADLLCELWRKRANWWSISTHAQRVAIVYDALSKLRGREPQRELTLELVVANLQGRIDPKYGHLRHEQSYTFDASSFESERELRNLAEVSVLSATIPVVFPPQDFKLDGQFWDGGIVNNTPVGNALKNDPDVDHMIIVTPDAEKLENRRYHWLSLFRLLEMVIQERLARDLTEAKSFNSELCALARAGVDIDWLKAHMGWKLLQFVELRPGDDLRGNLLTGFFRPSRRLEYLNVGKRAAERCLESWRPREFATAVSPNTPCPGAPSVVHPLPRKAAERPDPAQLS